MTLSGRYATKSIPYNASSPRNWPSTASARVLAEEIADELGLGPGPEKRNWPVWSRTKSSNG